MRIAEKVVGFLENSSIPTGHYFMAFIAIMTLRNFLEVFSDDAWISLRVFGHYYISYVCLAAGLILLFHFVTREPIEKLIRVILPGFIVLLIPPIFDLLVSGGQGYNISYLLPGRHDDLLERYLTFCGTHNGYGATPGMRLEIALVMGLSAIYCYYKTRSVLRSLILGWLVYSLIFAYGCIPFLARAIHGWIGIEYHYDSNFMRDIYFAILIVLGPWLYYIHAPSYCRELLRDLRYLRVTHYLLIFVLGIACAPGIIWVMTSNLFDPLFIGVSIVLAILFSLITNNLADKEIDAFSNRERPTIRGSILERHYARVGWVSLVIALTYALVVGFQQLFLILLFVGNYYLYSMPPYRLKRALFFSKFLIAINTFACFLMGYLLAGGSLRLPVATVAICLLAFTAVINFIDIKDYEGDRRAGIMTLPVLLGLKWSKVVIGLFFLITYSASYVVVQQSALVIPAILVGVVLFLLINRKNYSERPVFLVYLASIVVLILYLVRDIDIRV